MRRKPAARSQDDSALAVVWCASFFATLSLIAILALAAAAQAQTLPALDLPGTPALLAAPAEDEELEDEEEEEEEAEASEDEELEVEECEDGECGDENEADLQAPQECLLSSAQAAVFAAVNRDKVRLRVSYTTTSPTAVAVDYGLHGGRGPLYLGGEKRRLARKGVLLLTRSLTDAQMAKVVAAKGFTVRLRVAGAPRYCQALFDRQLNSRRATPSGLSWRQPK